MSRMVWIAVGAAGGIYAYKKLSQVVEDARGRGLVGNVNAAATTASTLAGNVRSAVAAATAKPAAAGEPAAEAVRGGGATGPGSVSSLGRWTQPRSDDASSTSSPRAGTSGFPARH